MTSEDNRPAGLGRGRARQAAIFRAGAVGRPLSIPTDAAALERRAKKVMSPTALAGADGVRQVIENIVAELDLTMGLLGARTITALSRDLLVAVNEDQLGVAGETRRPIME